jgi:aspartate/methionine/tyrosine aminotransferase
MKIESFELERWMNLHELEVEFDIGESGMAPLCVEELFALDDEYSIASWTRNPLGYNDAKGSVSLREEIAKTYAAATAENILITTGAIEANFLLFNVLLEPGDHVISPYPAYQQLYSVPKAIGCEVSFWQCRAENKFRFDLDELKKLIKPGTKMIVINFPHNPTGATMTPSELSELYAMAEAVGAVVLSDEAYRWLEIPGSTYRMQPAFDRGSSAMSVGTMSKPFGLPGLRIGWIAAAPDVIEKCRLMRHYVSLCPGKGDDFLALVAMRNRDKIFRRNAEMISENLAALKYWIERRADIISWNPLQAGLLGMLRYSLDIPCIDLADLLATQYKVLLAPGSVFGLEGCLRLGLGQVPSIFKSGIAATDRCFAELMKTRPVLSESGRTLAAYEST